MLLSIFLNSTTIYIGPLNALWWHHFKNHGIKLELVMHVVAFLGRGNVKYLLYGLVE